MKISRFYVLTGWSGEHITDKLLKRGYVYESNPIQSNPIPLDDRFRIYPDRIDSLAGLLKRADLNELLEKAISFDPELKERSSKIAIENAEKFLADIAEHRPSPPAGINQTQLRHLDQKTDFTGSEPAHSEWWAAIDEKLGKLDNEIGCVAALLWVSPKHGEEIFLNFAGLYARLDEERARLTAERRYQTFAE